MQAAMIKNHPGQSEIVFLPMIDLSASDESCIFSTLDFVASQGSRYNFIPVITFDQPFWWKSMLIVKNAPLDTPLSKLVLKLGGFHLLMSFLGSNGQLMDGLGLRDLLDLIYASNTVPHILSDKAVSRAIRGHIIIESALHSQLHLHQVILQ